MEEGDKLVITGAYTDGALQIKHYNVRGFPLATYRAYRQKGGGYKLYPDYRGTSPCSYVYLAGHVFDPRFFQYPTARS